MGIFVTIVSIIVLMFILDRIFLWLERKGWLYYRYNKPQGGVIGNALLELHAFLNPSARNTIEMKQNKIRFKKHESDVPGGLN